MSTAMSSRRGFPVKTCRVSGRAITYITVNIIARRASFLRGPADLAFLLPGGAQPGARLGIARVEEFRRCDPVCPEMAKALAQFAPGHDHAHGFEIGDRDGPDHALRGDAGFVAVIERDLSLSANGGAQFRHVDGVGDASARRRCRSRL